VRSSIAARVLGAILVACFASVAAGNLLSADDQWRKLELVAETARKVWGGSTI